MDGFELEVSVGVGFEVGRGALHGEGLMLRQCRLRVMVMLRVQLVGNSVPYTPSGRPFHRRLPFAGAHATLVLDAQPQINPKAELRIVKRDRDAQLSTFSVCATKASHRCKQKRSRHGDATLPFLGLAAGPRFRCRNCRSSTFVHGPLETKADGTRAQRHRLRRQSGELKRSLLVRGP